MESTPKEIRSRCTRFIAYHHRLSPKAALTALAAGTESSITADAYGAGELITGFEARIAALLGKEAAVFMPSGTMAQPIALRLWAERRGRREIALHPTSHLELHEHRGYEILHGLHGVPVGSPHRLLTLAELQTVSRALGALLLELPQREIGGQLPAWEELKAIAAWAQEESVYLHLDGARLWECQPFYDKSYAEIAALFDSVYVSFYKTLGGIAGAVLAGPADFIAEARIWQRRQGGNLVQLYPYVLAAQQGMDMRLPRIPAYVARAREFAAALATLPRVAVVPNLPQVNMMHLHLQGDSAALVKAALETAQESGVWLFEKLQPTALPGWHKLELVTGDASLEVTGAEVAALFQKIFAKAAL
jgi:threonine aldolase